MSRESLGTLIDDVRFRAEDGDLTAGIRASPPRAAIALGHGFGMTRADLVELARGLRELGYAVLLFDFRAHGGVGAAVVGGYHEARIWSRRRAFSSNTELNQ